MVKKINNSSFLLLLSTSILLGCTLISSFLFFYWGHLFLTLLSLIVIVLMSFTFLWLRLRFFSVAKFWLIIVVSLSIFAFSVFLGNKSDLYWILFILSSMSILFFSFADFKKAIALAFFPICTWLLIEICFTMNVGLELSNVIEINQYIHYLVIFLIILTQTVFVSFYIRNNFYFSNDLKNKNEQLLLILEANRQTTVELQEAYDELVKSRDIQIEMSSQVSFAKLVDGIAHEIKNPLHLIRARTELFLEKDADFSKEDHYRFSQSILKTIDRLTALMNPMFKYAKKDIDLNLAYFNLEEVVDDLILLSQRKCQEDGIALIKTNSFNVEVFADKNYIYQALMNIIVNSIQFTPEGGQISLSIITGITFVNPHGREVSGVRIDIRDTGKGIPADMLEKVFKPYITSKQSTSNVGLGLSIVFRYITSNNGLVKVDSIEAKGTTVSVFLPKSVS